MKCANCQLENRVNAQFCLECGQELEIACPQCGKTLPPVAKFCDGCGQPLHGPLSAKPPAPVRSTEGERKHVTVLFSDLSGYTAMSEKLEPEEVKEITIQIFAEVASIVSRYEGFVEKYVGDAVLALFGIPQSHEDDPIRAISVAQEIHRSVDSIAADYEGKIGRRLAFHTGITTGLVVTGEINLEKGTHGVAGDTINLASRLCGLAKPGEILANESTCLQSKGAFSFEKLEPVSLKGKAEPVIPYRLFREEGTPIQGLVTQGLASPLVGRGAEIAAIKASINRLLDGQGSILSVIGEAGLGKSRLMAEIRHSFANENLLFLEGRALSYGQKMSYWPFREILWQYAGITEDDIDTAAWQKFEKAITALFPADSAEILPYLATFIGLEVKGEIGHNLAHMDGESMGKQIYLSSRRFFEKLAQARPLVLVFEDLHWADESSVALIQHFFPLVTRAPLLICGISRLEENAPASRLRDVALKDYERRYTEIRLNPLSPMECMNLIDNLLFIENLPSRIRQLILTKADGNPFFVEEIMRSLVDRGVLHYDKGWKATSQIETVIIPDTIQGVITARIDRLDEEVKRVLKTASVIGRAFLYRLLKEVTEAVRDLDHDLDRLTETELIREKQKVPELEYIFKHALVQESTYESILLKKRHELHGNVASAIESLFADRLDEFASVLAYHYAKAENWEKAQEYLFKAGDQAGRIAADAEALTHYEQAMETYAKVFGDKWDPIQRGILERKMGEAFLRKGEYERAMGYFQASLEYLDRPRLATSRAGIRTGIIKELGRLLLRRLLYRSSPRPTHASVDRGAEEVMRVYFDMASVDASTGSEQCLLAALAGLNFSERKGHLPGIVQASAGLSYAAFFSVSLFRPCRMFLRRAVLLSKQVQDPSALVPMYFVLAGTDSMAGQLDRAIEAGLKGREICRTAGYWNLAHWAFLSAMLLYAYYQKGDLQRALAIAEETVRCGEDADEAFTVFNGIWCLGFVQERIGNFQESIAALTKAIELSERHTSHVHRVMAGSILGRCYCRTGDPETSLTVLSQNDTYRAGHRTKGWDYYLPTGLFMTHLIAAERETGLKKEQSLADAKRAGKRLFRWVKGYRVCAPEAFRLQGVYDWLTGKQASAEKHWRRSLALAEEMGMRYDLAMTHLEMGKRLRDHGHLRQAEAIFADIGAEFDLAEARRLLQGTA